MTRHGIGAQIKVRLYLEGRLVEGFVSLQVSAGVGSPATAQLELVPTNTIKHILPYTWVHVFTNDPWEANPAGDLSDYKLLFEGVVISRGFNKQGAGRNFVVQCACPAIFWTAAKQFWLNIGSADGGLVDQLAIQTSGGYGRFGQVAATGTYGYMVSKLAFADKEQPEERFLDTLISVLDDIGNVNPFYTNMRNRFRLTDRIIRGPAGKTEKLFQLALLGDFLQGLAGRVSGQTDLIEVVNQLLSAILHEWTSVLAPPYRKARVFDRDVFGNIKRNKKKVAKRGPRGRTTVDLFEFETAEDMVIGSYFFKPHVYTLAPPSCNVLFPNMFDAVGFSESFLQETTRLSMKPQLPMIGAGVTQGLLLQRPVELEVFTALVRDPERRTTKKRTPDGQFADGAGQTPTFKDFDWTTNEERVRGIVYNFVNLAPAPSTLTLADPGKKTPSGARAGGVPKYLQNVASYEWFKSKFASRQSSLRGPYNIRAVPGFSIVALDDSDANLNIVAYLETVQHTIDARGQATTQYGISHARLVHEVDFNQPKFQAGFNAEGELDMNLFRDADGNYDFREIFEGDNQPPIPEWFDESFRNVQDLDIKYKEWFGADAGVIQKLLFKNPGEEPDPVSVQIANALYGQLNEEFPTVGAALKAYGDHAPEFEQILEQNDHISVSEAIDDLNARYRLARTAGREFEEASTFTARAFTKIDEAFRFVGAAPVELADEVPATATAAEKNLGAQFTQNPAGSRTINYRTMRMDLFAGDTSAGSGYAGVPEGVAPPAPTTSTTASSGDVIPDAISGADAAPPADRMSGAFPVFDTKIHTGTEATDKKTRDGLIKSGAERAPSNRARYDGRPLMYDFEFRLWQQSLRDAGFTPTGAMIEENAVASDYYVEDEKGNVVRPKSPEEQAASIQQRKADLEARKKDQDARKQRGLNDPRAKKKTSIPKQDQAPTGDGLEQEQRHALPQPLSEKQVVDLRRAIIDAYRAELARSRGFSG